MALPTVAFHFCEQPGLLWSQTSAHAGNEMSRTAPLTRSMSALVTGTSTSVYFFPVVHGSRPTLQLTASRNSSSEYFHTSSVCASKTAWSFACWSGLSWFHDFSVIEYALSAIWNAIGSWWVDTSGQPAELAELAPVIAQSTTPSDS